MNLFNQDDLETLLETVTHQLIYWEQQHQASTSDVYKMLASTQLATYREIEQKIMEGLIYGNRNTESEIRTAKQSA